MPHKELTHLSNEKETAANTATPDPPLKPSFWARRGMLVPLILTVLTQMVEEGGLGEDIDQIPAVGLAPEWMSEKALAIGTYCMASGAYVMFGGSSPVGGMPDKVSDSDAVSHYISQGWEEMYGGKMEFVADPDEMVRRTLAHIDKKREALGLRPYKPENFGDSGDDRMLALEDLPFAERREALYGVAAD